MTNKLTTIIATRNRADALKNISLPSLLRQDCCDFEIIVWDASDGEDSREICASLAPDFKMRGIDLRYFRAPRVGSASQRNDAVKEAKGDFIFFIDDDCEVSPDGIGVLIKAFGDNPDRMGIGLLFEDIRDNLAPPPPESFYISVLRFMNRIFSFFHSQLKKILRRKRPPRIVLSSAVNIMPKIDIEGDAEWLPGGNMSFRRVVFEHISFDERLQKFGGYARFEDTDFSHRVMLFYGKPLLVTSDGLVRHFGAGGGRITEEEKHHAADFFNRFILRQNFGMKDNKNKTYFYYLGSCFILHALITGRFSKAKSIYCGLKMAKRAIN